MPRFLSILFFPALLAGLLSAQITGTVTNGTTKRPAAGVAVSLVAFQSGVTPEATTRTDAAGHFHFAAAPAVGSPAMVRADFGGVPYFATLPAGQNTVQVTVYDVSGNASQLHLAAQVTVVQPQNGQLAVVDEYVVDNKLDRTLYRKGGLFRFRVPRNVQPDGARVIGPSGMPITRSPRTTAHPGEYAVDYPVRPGETRFQVSYRLPYATQRAQITDDAVFPVDHMLVYVPPPMTFSGSGFDPPGQDEGYQVYEARSTTGPVIFTVAGDAPLPPQMQAGSAEGGNAASGAAAPAAAGIVPPPSWMEKNGYGVLAVLLVLAATGFGYLLTRPAPVAAEAGASPAAAPAAPVLAGGDREAQLARLKDDLFLLEVQRHTGHLDDAGYQRARQELDERMQVLARRPENGR